MVTTTPKSVQGFTCFDIESKSLRLEIFPEGGGKLTSLYHKALNREFLWRNEGLELEAYSPGTEYDRVFYGGIDELLPNDIPEVVQGIAYPDHGELWTTALKASVEDEGLCLEGYLPVCGLYYRKTVRPDTTDPVVYTDYLIRNDGTEPRCFLWKLHAALKVQAGDRIQCKARYGQVVDPEYSRFTTLAPFHWPVIEGTDVSVLPPKNGTMDFFYLYQLQNGEVSWEAADGSCRFGYSFDPEIFPYVWLFASHGGFLGHHTAILEPASAMPVSVSEAAALGQCTVLKPGEEINTTVTIYAGKNLASPSEGQG